MPDSDLAGTPDWLDRLRNGAELHGIHYEDCANPEAHWACGCKAVEDAYAAVAALAAAASAPQEGGGGAVPIQVTWDVLYASGRRSDGWHEAEARQALAEGHCRNGDRSEPAVAVVQRWRYASEWIDGAPPPAGPQVDREALARACKDAARDLAADLGRDDDWWRAYADRLAALLVVRAGSDG